MPFWEGLGGQNMFRVGVIVLCSKERHLYLRKGLPEAQDAFFVSICF